MRAGGEGAAQDAEKKMKGLAKKLKQIEELKKRQAAGEVLNADQRQKLETEEGIRQQIAALSGSA
jgi:uncharacterized protein with WD repeat